jgi:hypothetical protein
VIFLVLAVPLPPLGPVSFAPASGAALVTRAGTLLGIPAGRQPDDAP